VDAKEGRCDKKKEEEEEEEDIHLLTIVFKSW